jgi:predicted Zn-dependent peptidase
MFASYDWFLTYLDKMAKVTPAKIQKAAQVYLRPQSRVVGTYLPTGTDARP